MTEADTEAEMDFLIEWAIHMEVCVACRGFYAHLKQKYGYVHPESARLRCLDLGLIHVRPLR